MDWTDALEQRIARTGHERYRALCDDDHPDHLAWRRKLVEEESGEAPTPATYPNLFRQTANLAGAVGRVVGAVIQGNPVKVPQPVHDERLEICRSCEFNGARPTGMRCTKCGCTGLKLELATEQCPVGKWPAWR